MKSAVPSHRKLTTTHWEAHRNWSSYNYTKSCPHFNPDQSVVLGHWSKMESCKSSASMCLMSWPKKKKSHCFEASSSLILCNNNEPFLDRIVTCDETWVLFYSGDHQLSGRTEKKLESTSQSQTCTKKGVILTVWKSAARLIHYKLSESKWNYYIWEVYTANRWAAPKTVMPAASTGQQNVPNSSPWQCPITHHTTKSSKVNE